MTMIYTDPSRMPNGHRVLSRPITRPLNEPSACRSGQVRSRRPASSRPAGAPMRYGGTGVAMSTAPHRRRAVSVATTIGLAVLAGLITLWLGLIADFGGAMNNQSGDTSSRVPDSLAVVRVEPGESLQDVAARVAPGAPARQVAEEIRDLNGLTSSTVSAGQTLIAPVG
ncbi:hypothetical protein A5725_11950 [Mycobacterium kubicae]|uniref:LysM peptidoglycan-binding domain-containing protein n=1 Tax=Mycobacterium kubicae TaxID=120959 RepID=UPI000801D8B3|nr:LysM peptidoglycan-binding domain-containing protein [Mycobacterium kubicae]OBF23020.1 hypothetical protein A5725_11950 [Mycobacterium kubicae]